MSERKVHSSAATRISATPDAVKWSPRTAGYRPRGCKATTSGLAGMEGSDRGGEYNAQGECAEHFRLIAEHSGMILYDMDLSRSTVSWVGPIRRLTGMSGTELQRGGMAQWDLLIHDEDRRQVQQARAAAADSGAEYRLEYRIRGSDCRNQHVREHGTFLKDASGRAQRLLGTIQDVTEQKLSESDLQGRVESLYRLSLYLEALCNNERKVIAREIHDELGQSITALKYHIGSLQLALAKERRASISRQLAAMEAVVNTIFDNLRDILQHLRPRVLDDLGLLAAIDWQVEEFRKVTGIRVRYSKQKGLTVKPPAYCSFVVFRILQEALTNVMRHAGATLLTVSLSGRNGVAILRIADNGKGITDDEITASSSFGIRGIRERALSCAGVSLAIARGRRGGTEVRIAFPCDGGPLALFGREA